MHLINVHLITDHIHRLFEYFVSDNVYPQIKLLSDDRVKLLSGDCVIKLLLQDDPHFLITLERVKLLFTKEGDVVKKNFTKYLSADSIVKF